MSEDQSEQGSSTEAPGASPQQASAGRPGGGPLSGGFGIFLAVVLFAAAFAISYYRARQAPEPEPPVPVTLTCVCSETEKPFVYMLTEGEEFPVISPHTKRRTGYPAERCYWTRDGRQKRKPTYVILNFRLGKPGDTICPDCGRIVTEHFPAPTADIPFADEENAADSSNDESPTTQSSDG